MGIAARLTAFPELYSMSRYIGSLVRKARDCASLLREDGRVHDMEPRLSTNTPYVVEQNSVSDVRIDRVIVRWSNRARCPVLDAAAGTASHEVHLVSESLPGLGSPGPHPERIHPVRRFHRQSVVGSVQAAVDAPGASSDPPIGYIAASASTASPVLRNVPQRARRSGLRHGGVRGRFRRLVAGSGCHDELWRSCHSARLYRDCTRQRSPRDWAGQSLTASRKYVPSRK
ncbi:hypothetical protein EDE08_106318 [Bradyrhizobium sp. R2.2-H]|nr:hypothetical protein EDE10_10688 [Bradyrhizobium sp. Y-H1]TCU73258.1 hypothetical protein EDE08_106318 [Bradyrhizobium sp. R2.2-H]